MEKITDSSLKLSFSHSASDLSLCSLAESFHGNVCVTVSFGFHLNLWSNNLFWVADVEISTPYPWLICFNLRSSFTPIRLAVRPKFCPFLSGLSFSPSNFFCPSVIHYVLSFSDPLYFFRMPLTLLWLQPNSNCEQPSSADATISPQFS